MAERAETLNYLIIGGQPKAGTTSLFDWLSGHPEMVPSRLKESRFFLDANYPLSSSIRFDGTNLQDYLKLFPEFSNGKILLEATPDYLYSQSAVLIANLLPHAKMIFIVRDPIERLVSWYKFAKERGMLDSGVGFEDYIESQISMKASHTTPIHMHALEQCRLEKYLPAFQSAFGNRCLVLDFEELKERPEMAMNRVCGFVGIDGGYFKDFAFYPSNISLKAGNGFVRNGYYELRAKISYLLNPSPEMRRWIRPVNNIIKKIIFGSPIRAADVFVSEQIKLLIRSELAASRVTNRQVDDA